VIKFFPSQPNLTSDWLFSPTFLADLDVSWLPASSWVNIWRREMEVIIVLSNLSSQSGVRSSSVL